MKRLRLSGRDDIDARLAQIFDLFAEDSRLNVYAGELDVRPPGAPTIRLITVALATLSLAVGVSANAAIFTVG